MTDAPKTPVPPLSLQNEPEVPPHLRELAQELAALLRILRRDLLRKGP